MRLSRRTILSASASVAAAGAIALGVTLSQSDAPSANSQDVIPSSRAPLSPAQARASAQRLEIRARLEARRLARQQAAHPHPATPAPSRPGPRSPRARAAAVSTALENAAMVAGDDAAAPSPANASERASVPVELVTGVGEDVLNAVLSQDESGRPSKAPGRTFSVVQVPGTFTPPSPPPAIDQPDRKPISYRYLLVVTDEQTGEVVQGGMDEQPVELSRLSTVVTRATIPAR